MEHCYVLLGISPTVDTEEIEKAYQSKKQEFAPERFEHGSAEWLRATVMQGELDKAYNEAIMATFAPIHAERHQPAQSFAHAQATPVQPQFVQPVMPAQPPITQQQFVPPQVVQPQAVQPQAGAYQAMPPMQPQAVQPQVTQPQFVQPMPAQPQVTPVQAEPVQAVSPFYDDAPVRSDYVRSDHVRSNYARPYGGTANIDDSVLEKLVEDAPVSFTDEQLLNMDIGMLRESYMPEKEQSVLLTWGIEDRLLRAYVMAYAGFVFFDLVVNLSLGGSTSFSVSGMLTAGQNGSAADAMRAAGAAPSALVLILRSFVSTAYFFLCSLPMPIITRFMLLGQPAERGMMRWGLCFLGAVVAVIFYSLTSWILPQGWAGNSVSLGFVAMALCAATVRYEG